MSYYVYIITNKQNSVLYIGVTNNLERRISEHIEGKVSSFSARYKLTKLIYCEEYDNVNAAIARDKQLKGWRGSKKDALIDSQNPESIDYFSK